MLHEPRRWVARSPAMPGLERRFLDCRRGNSAQPARQADRVRARARRWHIRGYVEPRTCSHAIGSPAGRPGSCNMHAGTPRAGQRRRPGAEVGPRRVPRAGSGSRSGRDPARRGGGRVHRASPAAPGTRRRLREDGRGGRRRARAVAEAAGASRVGDGSGGGVRDRPSHRGDAARSRLRRLPVRPEGVVALGRTEGAPRARAHPARGAGRAPSRRADEPPRHRRSALARDLPRRVVSRRRARRQP